MNQFYQDYSEYISRFFPDTKIQKLSVNTGRGCPNRDGTLGLGGCIYCDNSSFTPHYCFATDGISAQLEKGKEFFGKKYKNMQYLAYFQSFSSTYGVSRDAFARQIEEALDVEDVVGIIISTRPDCINEEIVGVLNDLSLRVPIFVELGVESMHDDTLRIVNRGHDAAVSERAIRMLASAGIHVGVHLIAGLPGEDESMALDSVRRLCSLPIDSIKLHHLQVLKNTHLALQIDRGEINITPFTMEQYLEFCHNVISIVPKRIAIERFLASAPPESVISPKWGIKNYEFVNLLLSRLSRDKDR